MKYYEIVGYTYEATVHCDSCAADRFGRCLCDQHDVHGEDSDGNEITPIFAGVCEDGARCDDCNDWLTGPPQEESDDDDDDSHDDDDAYRS